MLKCKCEEAEAWKAKAEHMDIHLSDFQVLIVNQKNSSHNKEYERKIEYLYKEN